MTDGGERTERPTARRLARARAEGAIGVSAIAPAWFSMLAIALPLVIGVQALSTWPILFRQTGAAVAAAASSTDSTAIVGIAARWFVWSGFWRIALAGFAAASFAAIAAAAACGSLSFAPAALRPRLERLSWKTGAWQLLAPDGVVHAAMTCTAIAAMCWCIMPALGTLAVLAAVNNLSGQTLACIAQAFYAAWWRWIVALGLLAFIDIMRARAGTMRRLRMTPHEVREERLEFEGRTDLRARRRSMAAAWSRDVRVSAIRSATAIVTNPTHVAVALRYAPPAVDVPVVVARGADLAALLVRAIGAAHDIPIIESADLARVLFARAALGEAIPEECYNAVAVIFAWLLRTRGELRGTD